MPTPGNDSQQSKDQVTGETIVSRSGQSGKSGRADQYGWVQVAVSLTILLLLVLGPALIRMTPGVRPPAVFDDNLLTILTAATSQLFVARPWRTLRALFSTSPWNTSRSAEWAALLHQFGRYVVLSTGFQIATAVALLAANELPQGATWPVMLVPLYPCLGVMMVLVPVHDRFVERNQRSRDLANPATPLSPKMGESRSPTAE